MSDLISRQAAIANAISGRTREIDGEKWIRVSEVRESIKTLPSAEPKTCEYWDDESNYCALNRPSAQPERKKIEFLLEELSKKSPMVIATAYLYAINYTSYGVDVTEKWTTALQYSSALERAYRQGYHDAMQRQSERSKDA